MGASRGPNTSLLCETSPRSVHYLQLSRSLTSHACWPELLINYSRMAILCQSAGPRFWGVFSHILRGAVLRQVVLGAPFPMMRRVSRSTNYRFQPATHRRILCFYRFGRPQNLVVFLCRDAPWTWYLLWHALGTLITESLPSYYSLSMAILLASSGHRTLILFLRSMLEDLKPAARPSPRLRPWLKIFTLSTQVVVNRQSKMTTIRLNASSMKRALSTR